MKLALGTAQFGMNYGISNCHGQTSVNDVSNILTIAGSYGIDTLDTAPEYGKSEDILGMVGVTNWRVVTKVPQMPIESKNGKEWIIRSVEKSINKLKLKKLEGLLLHSPVEILGKYGGEIISGLRLTKSLGLVNKIGYSIYSPDDLPTLLGAMKPDLIQLPLNIFDQRATKNGWLQRLNTYGIEIHVRSIFLQGLLLMKPDERPLYFSQWPDLFEKWDKLSAAEGSLNLCLSFAKSFPEVSRVIIGINNYDQFQKMQSAWNNAKPYDRPEFACNNKNLIEPFRWPLPK